MPDSHRPPPRPAMGVAELLPILGAIADRGPHVWTANILSGGGVTAVSDFVLASSLSCVASAWPEMCKLGLDMPSAALQLGRPDTAPVGSIGSGERAHGAEPRLNDVHASKPGPPPVMPEVASMRDRRVFLTFRRNARSSHGRSSFRPCRIPFRNEDDHACCDTRGARYERKRKA